MTLIGVKSKYGSGWGTSPGLININDTPKKKRILLVEEKLGLINDFLIGAIPFILMVAMLGCSMHIHHKTLVFKDIS